MDKNCVERPPAFGSTPLQKNQRDKVLKVKKFKVSEKIKISKLLAETEDKPNAGTPLVVGISPIAVEPQTVSVAIEAEDVRVAEPAKDWFYCHSVIITCRLINIF